MKNSILFFVILLLSLSACQKDSESFGPVGNEGVSFRSAPRPFRATIDFVLTPPTDNVTCEAPTFRVGFSGEGNALHMGKISGEFNQCLLPGTAVTNGVGIITAANGDEVHITYEAGITREGNRSFINGTFTIVDGTGRFEGATGGGTLMAEQDLIPPDYPGVAVLEGDITY